MMLTLIVFIYSCPPTSNIKQKMLYASSRRAILSIAKDLGITIDTKIETSEVDELTLKFLKRELHGEEIVEEKKKGFARPRGPVRRVQKEKVGEENESASASGDGGEGEGTEYIMRDTNSS